MQIIVSQEIESVCPAFVGAAVEAQVVNTPYSKELWDEIHALEDHFRQELTTESLKDLPSIAATRRVYKACGPSPMATASEASMPTSSWATRSPWVWAVRESHTRA